MINAYTLAPTSKIYDRYVATTRKIAESHLIEALERAELMLSVAAHDRAQGRGSLQLPDGTDELIARIYREFAKRVIVLRQHHSNDSASSLQARLEKLRLTALSAGYDLTHQN